MSGSFYGAYLDTMGIEIEGTSMTVDAVQGLLLQYLPKNFTSSGHLPISVTNDASTQSFADLLSTGRRNILSYSHTSAARSLRGSGRGNQVRLGYELVTNPMPIPEMENLIYPVVNILAVNGDIVSDRAAIHYHIGFANNLRLLKNFLRISLMIDPVLFRLGGMGRTFRGHINYSAYSRPLLNSCVAYLSPKIPENNNLTLSQLMEMKKSHRQFVQVVNPMAALEANSLEEFWAAFGVSYRVGGGSQKYHPCRYSGINLYSIPQHGTVEFRHFNKILDPYLIICIGKFVRGLVELSTLLDKRDSHQFEVVPSNTEISMGDAAQIVQSLYSLCQEKEVDFLPTEAEIAFILEVMSQSSFKEIPEMPVITHLRDSNTIDSTVASLGKLRIFEKALAPNFVDIHNVGEKDLSLFDDLVPNNITAKVLSQSSTNPVPQPTPVSAEFNFSEESEEEFDEEPDFEDDDL